jgi:hypothetical protein
MTVDAIRRACMSYLVEAVEADCGRDLVKASARVRQLDHALAAIAALSPRELVAVTLGLIAMHTPTPQTTTTT